MTDIFNSQLFAAIVGALIGFFPAYWIGVFQEKRKEQKEYQAWLNGLSAELKHIKDCICEIKGIIKAGNPSTKRMNSDFLERARLAIFRLETDSRFLECLTTAYRDIIHTNDMLDRYENKTVNKNLIQPNVLASMNGVDNSVNILSDLIQTKKTSMKTTIASLLFWIRIALLIGFSVTGVIIAISKDEVKTRAASVPVVVWPVNPDQFADKNISNMARAVKENTARVSALISENEGQKAIDKLLRHPWFFWFLLLAPLAIALLAAAERIAADEKK